MRSGLFWKAKHGRASCAASAAVRVLGRPAAVERLLALLSAPGDGNARIRRDLIVYALIDICQDDAGAPGPDAERIAAACLAQLDNPDDEYETVAEAAVVASLAATQAAKDRATAMLARPQPPLAALAAPVTATIRPSCGRYSSSYVARIHHCQHRCAPTCAPCCATAPPTRP